MTTYKSPPLNHRQLLIGLTLIGYGVFLGEIYSFIYFSLWLVTHFLIMIGLMVWLLWPAARDRTWPQTDLDAPLLAMSLTMAISALLSPWPRLALEGMFPWLSQVLVFYLVIKLMRNGWSDSLLRALMLVTGVVLLVGLFEIAAWYFGLPFLPQFPQGWWELGGLAQPIPPIWYRLSFTLSNAVVLSAYLVLVIPLGVTYLFTTHRPADLLLVTLFVVTGFVILLFTFSRSGLIGLAVGLSALAVLWAWQYRKKLFTKHRLFVLSSLGLGMGLAIVGITYLFGVISAQRASSNAIRLALWQAALYLYQQYPIFGPGPGLFRWGWRFSPVATGIEHRYVTAHSLYLHQLAELGTLGGLVGLWFLIMMSLTAWRVLQDTTDSRLWWRRAGCIAGLAGFLGQGLFETFATWPIALPVIILAAYLIVPGPITTRRLYSLSRFTGPLLATLWLFCAVAITYFAWPRSLAEQARVAAAKGETQAAITTLDQSNQLDPSLILYQFELAEQLARLNPPDYQAARAAYQHALHLEPTYSLNYANLAAIEWSLGNQDAAINYVVVATKLAPNVPQFWLNQGFYTEETGDTEQALSAYTQAILNNPDWVNSNFWQATSWRKKNFAAIIEQVRQNLPLLQRDWLDFTFQLQNNNLLEAQAALDDLHQHDQTGYLYHLAGGELGLAQQDFNLALEHTQQAIQIRPKDSRGYALQAEILFELGKLEQAQRATQYTLFLDPNSTRAYYTLGRIKEIQELDDQAEIAYRRGYTPQIFSLDYTVAMYRQLGSLLPLPMLQKTGAGSSATKAWFALADLYQRQGRWSEASQVYFLLLNDDPYLDQARIELTKLCQKNQTECNQLPLDKP